MLQNQINQKLMHNEIFQEQKGCLSIQGALRRETNPGYHHQSNEKMDENINSDVTKEYKEIEGQRDYKLLTREQRRREADLHEHPYESENSPWRRQQTAGTGQGNSTYTNRY